MTRQRALGALFLAGAVVSGGAAGAGAAALALTLASKAIVVLTVEQAETLLVVAPLLGFLPPAWLLLAVRDSVRARQLVPAALGLWVAGGAVSFAVVALTPGLR